MIWESSVTVPTGGGQLTLHYFVMPPVLREHISTPCYGIGISDGVVTKTVTAFCPGKEEAVRVARMLERMRVTPVTFYDILEDYVAERE